MKTVFQPSAEMSGCGLDAAAREWFQRAPGRLLLAQESAALAEVLPDLFGYHVVQIGAVPGVELLSSSRITHRVVLSNAPSLDAASCYGDPTSLPLATDSVDVVVMPHVLEFCDDPHEALREAERILVPEGHLVITGLNPWSLLGLRRLFTLVGRSGPWRSRFLGQTRVRDWLSLLGFDHLATRHFFYSLPVQGERIAARQAFLERSGRRFWPLLGGGYVLVARKRVATMTPIKPSWRLKAQSITGGLVEPSTRNGSYGRWRQKP